MTRRAACAVSYAADLEPLFTLPRFPVSMYCVDAPPEADVFADMEWSISRGSGCVQLANLAPLDVVYEHEHGSGAVGGTWQAHHAEFASFLHKHGVTRALEIGAGHGHLAKQYLALHPASSWVVVEPNLPDWTHERATMVRGMFDADFKLPDGVPAVDAVVHSHTFEHMYEPRAFLESVNQFLPINGLHVFTLPRMRVWLQKHYSNTLNFEHTILLTETIIDELLRVTGFDLVDKAYFRDDHSVFYAARKVGSPIADGPARALKLDEYAANKALFMDFVKVQQDAVARINAALAITPGTVYLFGAHIFSQLTIAFGLNMDRVAAVIDNDPAKHGKRLYGTRLLVHKPDVLRDVDNAVVVLRVGAYRDEIVKGIESMVGHQNTVFVE